MIEGLDNALATFQAREHHLGSLPATKALGLCSSGQLGLLPKMSPLSIPKDPGGDETHPGGGQL